MELTDKQQAVVDHGEGPALVYAVAGAGKTTAMKHRIRRLVADGYAAPSQILAVSFATANVHDLTRGLEPWPECRNVSVRTIHSLSLRILRQAQRLGLPVDCGAGEESLDGLDHRVLGRARVVARTARVPFADE
ncbi:MAG: UvrD-helicase domain-containing protein, partial [Anaerolineae bacterium]